MSLSPEPGKEPMNPLAWQYDITEDPRFNLCGVSLMMPFMLFIVQFIFLLCIMGLVGPHIAALRFCIFAQSVDNQWDGVDISDHVDLSENKNNHAYPTTNVDALSLGTRTFLILFIFIRLFFAWVGVSFCFPCGGGQLFSVCMWECLFQQRDFCTYMSPQSPQSLYVSSVSSMS